MVAATGEGGPRSALVVLVPAAEPVVGRWRALLDPTAAREMPAHVTLLWPWLRRSRLGPEVLADLAGVLAAVPAFVVAFDRVERFDRTLWLAPTPAGPFVALTERLAARWPDCPPFGGRYDAVVPHLTVADGVDPAGLAEVVEAVEPQLPVRAVVDEVTVMLPDRQRRWRRQGAAPLAPTD